MIKLEAVKAKAKIVGVKKPASNKTDLIKQIQKSEGFTDCFKSLSACNQMNCCWREECLEQ